MNGKIIPLEPMAMAQMIADLYALHDAQHDVIEKLMECIRLLNNRVVKLEHQL